MTSPRSPGLSRPVSERVVEVVAAERDADPLELEPLYHTVDPESLNALFDGGVQAPNGGHVTFRYNGYEVTVSCDDSVTANPTVDADAIDTRDSSSHPGGEPEAPD